MMKKLIFISVLFFSIQTLIAQPEDPKQVNETALSFIRSGDYDNAILVLNRGLQQDKNNLELQKSLVMAYYYKKDYAKALEGVKVLVDRDDADVMTYQIAGNVYKALEEVKDCDKMYKKALKKFPNSGPLHSEYGELLWAIKDFNAIQYWEKGIQVDPGFSGNYYNAAQHYFYTQDKVWAVIYGEIFVNMESLTERGASMKKFLLDAYKEKLFQESDMLKDIDKNKSEFAKAYLNTMNKQASLANKGISTEVLTMIRTRFILDWYNTYGSKFPHKLFDYQLQLIREGMFESYNQWLFGTVENLAAYDNWTKTNPEKYTAFTNFQKNRIFRMPATQYYQAL
jgi:tetratricopeptide (TPR) repeat protein